MNMTAYYDMTLGRLWLARALCGGAICLLLLRQIRQAQRTMMRGEDGVMNNMLERRNNIDFDLNGKRNSNVIVPRFAPRVVILIDLISHETETEYEWKSKRRKVQVGSLLVVPLSRTQRDYEDDEDDDKHKRFSNNDHNNLKGCSNDAQETSNIDIPIETCNLLHELDVVGPQVSLLSTYGTVRQAWKMEDQLQGPVQQVTVPPVRVGLRVEGLVVLRMLHLHQNFTTATYRAHRTDARIMEELTASPFIASAHAFCGQSVVTPMAVKAGIQLFRRSKPPLKQGPRALHNCVLTALHLASGLHHLHTHLWCHGDLKMHNALLLTDLDADSDVVAWNDFNFAQGLDGRCGSPMGPSRHAVWGCPGNMCGTNININVNVNADCDMYGFGNVLFQLITGEDPWVLEQPENGTVQDWEREVVTAKCNGHTPRLPTYIQQSSKPVAMALVRLIRLCYEPKPPTAGQVAAALNRVLVSNGKLSQKQVVELVGL
jgi:hypothetical protein